MPDPQYDTANSRIQDWSFSVEDKLKQEMVSLGIRHRANSQSAIAAINALKTLLRRTDGLTDRISYQIPRHMIFVHKGVGKGTPAAMAGQTKRKAKPWFNPVVDQNINELADIVAEEMGSAIINNLLIN